MNNKGLLPVLAMIINADINVLYRRINWSRCFVLNYKVALY